MSISSFESHSPDPFWGENDHDLVVIGHEDVSNFNPENILPQPDQTLDDIRIWLNPTRYDHDGSEYQKHLSSHLSGTGAWAFESQTYQQWHDSDEHGILWIRGIPGSGKSVLASTLIHRLVQESVPVLFFFFRHTIDANHGPEALLRDWLAQILNYSPPLQLDLMECSQTPHEDVSVDDLSLTDLWRYLRTALTYLPRVYCVVDALDEMDRDRLEPFLTSLDALGQWRPAEIKLVVTSRPVSVVEEGLRGVKVLDVRLDKKHVEADVARYVQHRLDASSVAPESHAAVKEVVIKKADGLFLYAKLALDSLPQAGADVSTHLEDMPADLSVMYTNLLREHASRIDVPAGLQELVLQLVTHATRPLRLLEIAELIRVTQEDQRDLGTTKSLVRSICGPLLEVLPDETVRVVHHSLTEFLNGMTQLSDVRPFPVFDAGTTHNRLAALCLSYLAAGSLDHVQVRERRSVSGDVNYVDPAFLTPNQVLPPFAQYAGSNWAVHVHKAIAAGHDQKPVNSILDVLLVGANLDKLDVLSQMRMTYQPSPLHVAIAFDLRDYARTLIARRDLDNTHDHQLDPTFILYAAEKGNDFMVKLLLEHGADPAVYNDRGRTPLHLAVRADHTGDTKVASVLLDAGVNPNVERGPDNYFGMFGEREPSWTPSGWTFTHGSFDMAMVFYRRLQTRDDVGKALHQAVIGQNTRVIPSLLQHPMIDVDTLVGDSTALFEACLNRDAHSVSLLLDAGADPNILRRDAGKSDTGRLLRYTAFEETDMSDMNSGSMNVTATDPSITDCGENALHALTRGKSSVRDHPLRAAEEDELLRCFELLFKQDANVHQVDVKGHTPLHLACDAVSARSLLEGGADPNAANVKGETALHTSCTAEVLEVLLPKADPNRKTIGMSRTPLLHALVQGNSSGKHRVQKALRLVDHGADVTAVDSHGNSALHLVAGLFSSNMDGIPLIEKLCSLGADANLKNHQGKTPLHMQGPGAGRRSIFGCDDGISHPKVLRALVADGADPEIKDNQGQTPLFQWIENPAIWHGRKWIHIVGQMVEAGSQMNTVDSGGRTLLHAAVGCPHVDLSSLDLLVARGLDPKLVDNEGNTLLHEAAPRLAKSHRLSGVVTRLIDMGVDPERPNHLGRTPLHVLSSFRPGAFDPCITRDTLTSRPSNADDPTMFDRFLDIVTDIDGADKLGITPLHLVSTFSEYMTRRLLEVGASPMKASAEGLTAFHLAARSRQANIIGILLDWLRSSSTPEEVRATLNAEDILNRTALYYASASGVVESVQLLLGARASPSHATYAGSPWNGCADFEEEQATADWSRLLKADWRSQQDRVIGAAEAGGVMISDTARPEKVQREDDQDLPFPTERLDEIIDLLASHAHEDTASVVGQAITSAAERGFDYTVECLLRTREKWGFDVTYKIDEEAQGRLNKRQDTRSSLSAAQGQEIVTDLMRSRDYALVHDKLAETDSVKRASWHEESTPLHRFVLGGFTSLVSEAATEENISKTEWHEERDGATGSDKSAVHPLLISACQRELPNMDAIRVLVEDKRVDVNARTFDEQSSGQGIPNGPSALHHLAAGTHWWQAAQAIPYLVEHGADLELKDWSGLTALGIALRTINGPHFSKKTVEILLLLGADPKGSNRWGDSYLSMTVQHREIFELLIQHGAVVTRPTMIAAMQQKDVELLRTMLTNGADPNMRKVGKEVPELRLSENSFTRATHDPDQIEQMYPLHWLASIAKGDSFDDDANDVMFKILLDHGADPFARYERTTVCHQILQNRALTTVSSGQNRYLDALLGLPDVDLETCDSDGMTILLLACCQNFSWGDDMTAKMILKLRDLGADIRARDNKGRSAMHHLCKSERDPRLRGSLPPKDITFITTKAPDLVDSADANGKTPLHYSLSAHNDVADMLITAGADVRHADQAGNTPLHLLLHHSAWKVHLDGSIGGPRRELFDRIVGMGADLNARDRSGETPLFACFRTATVLAEIESLEPSMSEPVDDKQIPWSDRHRARWWREWVDGVEKEDVVWALFEQHGADWRVVNHAGENLLHIVAQDIGTEEQGMRPERRVRRFEFLMSKGLDPTTEDKEHRTPLDLAAALGLEDLLALFKSDE